MLVVGDPAGAIPAAFGQPPGDFGAAHGDKALIAVGVGTLGDELHRAGAVQADDAEEREGVVGGDAGVGGDVPSRGRVLWQKPPEVGQHDLVPVGPGGERHGRRQRNAAVASL